MKKQIKIGIVHPTYLSYLLHLFFILHSSYLSYSFILLLCPFLFLSVSSSFFFFHVILSYLPCLINIIYYTGMLLLFVLMGAFAGFTSARLYKTFKGRLPHSHSISQSNHFNNSFVRTYSSNIVRTCCLHLLHYLPLPIFIKFIRPLLP